MTTYYHGTSTALEPGATLVPGVTLGRNNHPGTDPGHDEHVHVTTSLPMAAMFALAALELDEDDAADLFVYVVQPVGPLTQDPGGIATEDYRCASATVVREAQPSELRVTL